MSHTHLLHSARSAFVASVLIASLVLLSFVAFEPIVGRSATEIFEVHQTITAEISFLASTSPVTMNGSIAGVTGGTSWGTTTARVQTNNSTGYTMTIKFASSTAMYRDGGNGQIPNYLYSTGTADYPIGFNTTPSNGQFGFSVNASNTAEVSNVYRNNGTDLCGTNNTTNFDVNTCWRGASTTVAAETQLINSSAATPVSGSTSTIQFRVTVPNNPNPAIPTGTYTATATLTAITNP